MAMRKSIAMNRIAVGAVVVWIAALALPLQVSAQISDDIVKIGVLNDQAGIYADITGPGSVIAARMAVEDFGGSVLGKRIEVVAADHQNKADVGANVVREWLDIGKVDMIVGFANSAVALAGQQIAKERNRIAIATAVGTADFTGKACAPTSASWLYDSYALTNGLARAVVKNGLDTWFFITVDYAFGHSVEADARAAVIASGGRVLGSVRHPINTADFSSYLVQAKASGAKVIALANAGGDLTNSIKQAAEFGIVSGGQAIVTPLVFITDVHSLGMKAAQGLTFLTAFYWDRDDESRAWSKRFSERHKTMPTMEHASVYSGVRHYLRSVEAAKTDEAKAVMAKMRELPVNDFYTHNGRLRLDGRLVHDMYLVQVKKPEDSKGPWDHYAIVKTIPGNEAFRPVEESGCPLATKR